MTEKRERFTQEITEILPANLRKNTIDYRPKGIKRFDPRKTCLNCGYLCYVRIHQVDVAESGSPVFERTEGLVDTQDRSQILVGGNNQLNAKDLNCFRGMWSITYSNNDVRKRIEQGLEQATRKHRCPLFFPWSPGDSPEVHRELHRERTARRYNLIAAFVGAIIGGALSFLWWYLTGGK